MGLSASAPPRPLVIWHPGATPPAGYIKANGALLSRSAYAWLFGQIGETFGAGDGVTTFAVPDLRGEFLRGHDDGRGVDVGRGFGTSQAGGNAAHSHGGAVVAGGAHSHTVALQSQGYGSGPAHQNTGYLGSAVPTTSAANHSHGISSDGGVEARPRNVAGLFCIAYAP